MSNDLSTPVVAAEEKPKFFFERHQPDWLAMRQRVLKYRGNRTVNYDDIFVSEHCAGCLPDLPHFAHPTFVMAPKKSVLGQTMISKLFDCKEAHSTLVICHGPGVGTAILGLLHNSVSIKKFVQIPFIFGDDQKAAAEVITLGIYYGILPQDPSVQDGLVIGFQQYRDPTASEHVNAYDNAVAGYANAMIKGLTGGTSQEEALAACGTKSHPFSDVQPHDYPKLPGEAAA